MLVRVLPDAGRRLPRRRPSVIEDTIRPVVAARGRAVLGLATGSTPEAVYARLVERHEAGALSFRDVTRTTSTSITRSARSIRRATGRTCTGTSSAAWTSRRTAPTCSTARCPRRSPPRTPREFDRWIEADGGLDLQLLGIGRNGHIGFNEPSDLHVAEALRLPTRLVDLHPVTRADAARDFGAVDAVIPRALTMGVAPILAARSIVILATGAHKAEAVAAALTGPMTAAVPASLLQSVADRVTWILDEPAARGLPDR